jgi:hypothetical protein
MLEGISQDGEPVSDDEAAAVAAAIGIKIHKETAKGSPLSRVQSAQTDATDATDFTDASVAVISEDGTWADGPGGVALAPEAVDGSEKDVANVDAALGGVHLDDGASTTTAASVADPADKKPEQS